MNKNKILFNVTRTIAAIIMLQTLFFKFTGAEESVYIFSTLGIEPWGRILSGIMELIASVLLFYPGLVWMGALLGSGIMAGAIISHLTLLGISVKDDHGYLFFLAITVFCCCIFILWKERRKIPVISKMLV